jgi:glucokinase
MLKYSNKDFVKNPVKEKYSGFYLGADVGGTFTRFAVAGSKGKETKLIFTLKFETPSIKSIIPALEETLRYSDKKHRINIRSACIGSAGIISESEDFVELTNAKWSIDKKEIIDKTYLNDVFLINDFEALGFGVNLLDKNSNLDIFKVRENKKINSKYQTKAVIGAGTGLGKCILTYNEKNECYMPISSEGGNSDFPHYNEFEADLVQYIKKLRNIKKPLVYEELLSGRGLEGIYSYLSKKSNDKKTEVDYEIQKSEDAAQIISKYRKKDKKCKETFKLFSSFYARCAKNFALDTLCKDGMYIAGGIAAKNKDIFQSKYFIDEFNNGNRREEFLRNVPIYVILNDNAGLLGACYAAKIKVTKDE